MNFADLPLSALVQAINFTPASLFECAILASRTGSAGLLPAVVQRFSSSATEQLAAQRPICAVIALERRDLESAAALVGGRYAARGYLCDPADARQRHGHQQSSSYFTLLAGAGEEKVGTVTLGFDSTDGLLVDEGNQARVDEMRAKGARLTELVRLAVTERAESTRVLAALFNAAYGLGRARNATDLLIEVNPRHVNFYTRSLGFEVIGSERICPRVGAPAVLLRLEVATLSQRIEHIKKLLGNLPL